MSNRTVLPALAVALVLAAAPVTAVVLGSSAHASPGDPIAPMDTTVTATVPVTVTDTATLTVSETATATVSDVDTVSETATATVSQTTTATVSTTSTATRTNNVHTTTTARTTATRTSITVLPGAVTTQTLPGGAIVRITGPPTTVTSIATITSTPAPPAIASADTGPVPTASDWPLWPYIVALVLLLALGGYGFYRQGRPSTAKNKGGAHR